jgi:hypothetical protein
VAREEHHEILLSGSDITTLQIGLTAYLREFAAHRAEDGGASHPEEEWVAIKKQVGQLLWRLEAVTKPPGADIIHSEHAVRPDSI